MVCKEELCKWFKNLRPHQRIDYMCGLLHMCLPLELRFLGSVLEDHGKKNYNYLRDAELKANNNAEISKLYSGTERQLRATVSVYLSLLHSSNTACAQLLYEVLEKNLDRAFTFGTDPNDNEEIRMALTLAINHPAFQFHQKNSLYQHFARYNPESSDRRSKSTEKLDLSEEQPSLVNNPTAELTQGFISNIELKDSKRQGKRLEVKINVTWSNGDVFELMKTGREMHEFQLQLRDLFPEQIELQKREWKMLFHGHYHQHHGHGHKEDQSRSLSNYFSMLLRNQPLIRHEDVLEFFKGGNLVHQAVPEPEVVQPPCITRVPLAQMSVNTGEEQGIPPFPLKSLTVCNSQLHHFSPNFMVAAEQSIRLPRRNSSDIQPPPPSNVQRLVCPHGVLPPQVDSPSQSPPSSTTESPLNSRSASPANSHPHSAPDGCTETKQLLNLLSLEQYTDTLGKLSLKQLKLQTPEDLSRAGLPFEAQNKLRSKLDNINREKSVPSVNGLVDSSSSGGTLSPASPNSIPWNQIHPSYLLPLPFSPTYSPTLFAQYPTPAAPQPPPQQQEVGDTSPHDSDTDSPTAQMGGLPKDKTDSSGSDNDKDKSLLGENDKPRQDGRRRAWQNRTIPQHRGPTYSHHVGDESKPGLMRLPSSVNVYPESKQDLPQAGTISSYNGYQSDPNPSPVTSNNYPRPATYYPQLIRQIKPSPAHTNLSMHNKNIINMPQEGHIKQQQPMVMYYPQGVRTDIPMTTGVMPMNLNNNTVTNQTYSANNEGNVPNSSQRQYLQTMMSRPIVLPAPRSVPANLNNISSVSVTQGASQPLPGHSPGPGPGPANISVKPTNGVQLPIPNPSGTPPESVHSGSDSPLQMLHNSSAGSTTLTLSTATSFPSTPQTAVSSANHSQCSSCGCNCNLTSSSQSGYQPHFNTLPYHFLMHPGLVNGMMAPFSNMAYGHVPPPNYPNGISHEMYNHPGFPQHMHPVMAPHIVQSMYGNLSHHGQGNPAAHTKHKPQGCYNCGSPQHKAQDCKDPSMDGMSGNYHLNYKPKSDSD